MTHPVQAPAPALPQQRLQPMGQQAEPPASPPAPLLGLSSGQQHIVSPSLGQAWVGAPPPVPSVAGSFPGVAAVTVAIVPAIQPNPAPLLLQLSIASPDSIASQPPVAEVVGFVPPASQLTAVPLQAASPAQDVSALQPHLPTLFSVLPSAGSLCHVSGHVLGACF